MIGDPRPLRSALGPLGLREHCPDGKEPLEFLGDAGERAAVWSVGGQLRCVLAVPSSPRIEVVAPDPPALAVAVGGILNG